MLPGQTIESNRRDKKLGINLIVRCADLRESSTIQLHLAERLKNVSFLQTRFLHHPLLIRPDGAKLSKSQGDATLKAMRESGTEASVVFEKFARWLDLPEECGATLTDLQAAIASDLP